MNSAHLAPSEIIALIDAFSDAPKREDEGGERFPFQLDISLYGGVIQAIIDLVDRIPKAMLPTDAETLKDLYLSIGEIRYRIECWRYGRGRDSIVRQPHTKDMTALGLLRSVLRKCSETYIPEWIDELRFVENLDLREDIRNDVACAHSSVDSGNWKAACVLAGSAVEALILDNHSARLPEVTAMIAGKNLGLSVEKINYWGLASHLDIAKHLGALRDNTVRSCDVLRDFRNLVHPGRSERLKERATRGKALHSVGALVETIEDLSAYSVAKKVV